MTLEVAGADHRSVPLEVREKVAVPGEILTARLRDMRRCGRLTELVIISTCNRVEFYYRGSREALFDYVASTCGISVAEAEGLLYHYSGAEAAAHLFAVAAGLESMVLGETEVLSQCKAAYEEALAAGTTGPVTNAAFQRAFAAAKRVHSETAISRGRTSIGSIAATLAREEFGMLSDRTVLVIGAGTMARNTLQNLARLAPGRIVVANRSVKKAALLARSFGGRAARLSSLPRLAVQADVIVAAAARASYILTAKALVRSQKERKGAPCLILDIAVPRNVEPSAQKVKGVSLFNIDSLRELAHRNASARKRARGKAHRIIEAQAKDFEEHLAQRALAPVISALEEKARALAAGEVRRALRRIASGVSPGEEISILADRLVGKLLHAPVSALKESLAKGDTEALCEAAKRLHGLGNNGDT
ncbi:MAG: glutamyl-tRNA reductase [Planctomycetes bacterium]|nr:glutamyl-tRNA reductase [Planctomycetota bacterium]